ncbi:hypothetical protein AKJ41_04855 [candidate division MSBL1 archaeon SCGC-AAA259O05]|uniref:Uncharacterized protein n=1 Tax=candidate division MSBL1 archaeon SCGC-AAA259O05 TaxID=1698271 RepID=A0A133V035_9EURY|nr:hypothetical protein AKJ41_04855 [candidate division MSBL1 archaeon SCGC-AAA259O05]
MKFFVFLYTLTLQVNLMETLSKINLHTSIMEAKNMNYVKFGSGREGVESRTPYDSTVAPTPPIPKSAEYAFKRSGDAEQKRS